MNFFQSTLTYFRFVLFSLLKYRLAVLSALILPVIVLGLFYLIEPSYSAPRVGIVREFDQQFEARVIALKKETIFRVTEGTELEIVQLYEKGQLDGYIQSTDGNSFNVVANPSNQRAYPLITQVLPRYFQANPTVPDMFSQNLRYTIVDSAVTKAYSSLVYYVVPAIVTTSVFLTILLVTTIYMIHMKKREVWNQLLVLPVSPLAFVAGYSLAILLLVCIQSLVILSLSVLVFQYYVPGGIGSIITSLLSVLLGAFLFLGFGLILAGLSRSYSVVVLLSLLFFFPQVFLSGVFLPLQNLPGWVGVISQAMPLFQVTEIVRLLTISNLPLWAPQVVAFIGFLTLWIVFVYSLVVRVFKPGVG